MNVLKNLWNNLERYLMVFFLVCFLLNVTAQIIARVVFNAPLFFAEEISRYTFLWMVMIGLAYGTKFDRHIRVKFLVNKLPETAQDILEIALHALILGVYAWLTVVGVQYVGYSSISKTFALQIPKSIVVAIIPLSSFLMVVRCAEKIVKTIRAMANKRTGAVEPAQEGAAS